MMLALDYEGMKSFIDESGLKQKSVAEKAGMSETAFTLILQGKRKCEVGEYARICTALNVSVNSFLKKIPVEA